MDKCREAFEKWFKTTESYKLVEEMNYFKVDLFTFREHRNEYQHSAIKIAYVVWQEQQKRIDEINQENEKLKLDHAAYKKGMKNIIREKLKQVEGRDFTIAAMERSLVLVNAKVNELQARLDGAYVKLAMLRQTELCREDDIHELFEELEQALAGEKHE